MPHAHHFLERLDRVPRSLADFALSLYRDVELLQWILAYARLPREEERVALSLQEASGPYVVVTRDGHFVTALAEGMTTGDLRVLSRPQIDAFAARVRDARARKELAADLAPPGKQPSDLLTLLNARPHQLSREEVRAIGGWNPILWFTFLRTCAEVSDDLRAVAETWASSKGQAKKLDDLAVDASKRAHGAGARFALATMGDVGWAEPMMAAWKGSRGPSHMVTELRLLAPALRGFWAAARMGKPALAVYRRALDPESASITLFDAALGATAVGLRHARAAGDARRIVEDLPAVAGAGAEAWSREIRDGCLRALERPEEATDAAAAIGRKVYGPFARLLLPEGSPHRFDADDDVPRELALLAVGNLLDHDCQMRTTIDLLPWVARLAAPEDMYFPEEIARVFRLVPLRVDSAFERIQRQQKDLVGPKVVTVRKAAVPERNAPCSCGSGKKYKKCCGA
jgi:hypothetical protein